MTRVAVVTSSPPSVEGGHLVIARSLVAALRDTGHDADLVVTPSHPFGRQASAYLATWRTDVRRDAAGRPVDRVVSLRYPSYAVRHPAHVCWLNHRMREYYDGWPRFAATLGPISHVKERLRRAALHAADSYLLRRNVNRVFAQSRTIQARLRRFGGIQAEVLYPPAPQRPYRCDAYGDEILAVSRLTPLKRLDLLVRALAEPVAAGVRCAIAGDGEQREALTRLAGELGLDRRIRFVGAVDPAGLVQHFATCRAVCFPPLDEDYGFVTVEAFSSRKPVVTCTDSGGPAELVRDGVSGFVCEPTPAALAKALACVAGDRELAERLGAAGFERAAALTWPATVKTLLA